MARNLLVDDSVPSLEPMSYELDKAGYAISTAARGRKAIARMRARRPDCVLLDVPMPEIDGFETCRQIKADPDPERGRITVQGLTQRIEESSRRLPMGQALDSVAMRIEQSTQVDGSWEEAAQIEATQGED